MKHHETRENRRIADDELIRLLLNSTGEGIYGIDLKGDCTFANPACVKLLGYDSDEELLGQNMHDLVHHTRPNGEPYPEKECRIYQALRQDEGTHVDDEVLFRKDGTSFQTEYWSYPIFQHGERIGCVLTFVDITERRKAEKQAKEAHDLIRLLMNSTAEGIYGIDLKGNCTFANAACLRLLGYDHDEELLGRNMHDLVHHTRPNGEPYPEKECRIYQALRQDEGTHVDDEVLFRKDGTSFQTEYWSYPIFQDGKRVGCVLTFVDISERRAAEKEVRDAHELIKLLMNSTGEGIYGIDLQGNCTFANSACLRLLGYDSDQELLGRNMHDLVHHTRPNGEPYPEKECRIYQALRQNEGTHVDDEVLFRKDGSKFPVEYWSYPTFQDGKRVGCVLTFVDISQRLTVEEEMRQTEKMVALGKMSAGLAHELNNPSAAVGRAAAQFDEALDLVQASTIDLVRGGCGADLWDTLTERVREFRDREEEPPVLSALQASDREEELIDWFEDHGIEEGWSMAATFVQYGFQSGDLDALSDGISGQMLERSMSWLARVFAAHDLARIVRNGTKSISELVGVIKSYSYMDQAAVQFVDIHRGIDDTITLLHHKLKKGVEVVRDYDDTIPKLQARGSELNQVWTNLIDNAVDAMGGEGTITIRTYPSDSHVVVEIEDDGPGIPSEIQSRIFDPFFTTKEVGSGTGLGLDVVKRIVTNRAGGEIDVRSRPGETVFTIRLPVESGQTS